jgi:transcriptional regulator with GAF, ATPase, and Fis domain
MGDGRSTEPYDADAVVEALLASENCSLVMLDSQLRYQRVGRLIGMTLQRAESDMIGLGFGSLHAVASARLLPVVRDVLETGRASASVSVEGDQLWMRGCFEPVRVAGEMTGVIGLFVDVGADVGPAPERLRFERLLAEVASRTVPTAAGAVDWHEVVRCVGEALGFEWVALELFGDGAAAIDVAWCSTERAVDRESLLLSPPIAAARRGGPLFVDSFAPAADGLRAALDGAGLCSLGVMPLVDEAALGVLSIGSFAPREWLSGLKARLDLIAQLIVRSRSRELSDGTARVAAADRLQLETELGAVMATLIDVSYDALDAAIDAALDRICEMFSLARALVAHGPPEGCVITHSSSRMATVRPGDVVDVARFISSASKLDDMRAGRVTVIEASDITAEARAGWEKIGARCVMNVPVIRGGGVTEIVTFHCRTAQVPAALPAKAHAIAQMISQALSRRQAERERAAAFEELDRLKASIEAERDYLRAEVHHGSGADAIVVESEAMRSVMRQVKAVAATNASVLIRGETGVGKEVVARAIHAASKRREGPLVKVNCASIPRDLFESEFFGHVRGAFTGALRDRAGRFVLAEMGTLFLDEVGEIPLSLQPKLLRVLQESELERVGDDRTRKVDVRVIAATNRSLDRDVEEGLFRRDLYYRLAVIPIHLAPLRERTADILPLARRFLVRHAQAVGKPLPKLTCEHETILLRYDWPGNVRELNHVMERALILSAQGHLDLDSAIALHRPPNQRDRNAGEPGQVRTDAEVRLLERENLLTALEAANWQIGGKTGAAERVGISPSTLRDRMRAFGIEAPARAPRKR